MIDYDAVYNQIKTSLEKDTDNNSANVLKPVIGSVIIGRFVPNLNDIANSLYHYYWYSFNSRTTADKKFALLSPFTIGQKDPIAAASIKLWKSGNPALQELSKPIRRRESWSVNFYVQSDNKNPENNGKVKILRWGKQIQTIVDSAMTGDNKEFYGKRIWRLDDQGCSFRLKAEANSNKKDSWPTYTQSSFLPQSAIEGMTAEKQKEIMGSVHDLTKQYKLLSYAELEKIINEHYLIDIGVTTSSTVSMNIPTPSASTAVATLDEIPGLETVVAPTAAPAPVTVAAPVKVEAAAKPQIQEIGMDELDKMLDAIGK